MYQNMASAIYNDLNLPYHVYMQSGNGMGFRYLADGRRIETSSSTVGTPLILPPPPPPGSPAPPPVEYLFTDTEMSFGPLTWRNGILTRYDFQGGFFSLYDDENELPQLHPYAYITDHLGSVRLTVDGNGSNSGTENARQGMEYLPSGAVFRSTNYDFQTRRFCGKELLTMHGWNMYDSKARLQYALLPRFSTMDPLAEKYYSFSPYNYAGNDFVNKFDENGDSVIVFATSIPSEYYIPFATHTFIGVKDDNGTIQRFSYGPERGGLSGMYGENLVRCYYQQDKDVVEGKADGVIKARIPITPPNGMTMEEFDNAVINAAQSLGKEGIMKYAIIPFNELQGNCNTSTSTILFKAGVSKKQLQSIGSLVPGIKTGFGSIKPWSSSEQREALQRKKEKERISNQYRYQKSWLR